MVIPASVRTLAPEPAGTQPAGLTLVGGEGVLDEEGWELLSSSGFVCHGRCSGRAQLASLRSRGDVFVVATDQEQWKLSWLRWVHDCYGAFLMTPSTVLSRTLRDGEDARQGPFTIAI